MVKLTRKQLAERLGITERAIYDFSDDVLATKGWKKIKEGRRVYFIALTDGVSLGEGYPSGLSLDEAKKVIDIEKGKSQITKYQNKIIDLYVAKKQTELSRCLNELTNFLRKECNLTTQQSTKWNQLISDLVETLQK